MFPPSESIVFCETNSSQLLCYNINGAGSEGYVQVDGTQTSGPAAPGHSKGGAKPSSSKGGKKANTKDGSPANSDDEGETETRNNDGAGVSKGGVKGKEEDDEEEENMEMEFGKYHTVDPDKMR